MIVNVISKPSVVLDVKLRDELLNWVNTTLKSKFTKIEELCTGAAYCQLLHLLFPNSIPIRRVKFITNLEHECFENFKILQMAFQKLGVSKVVPASRLSKGKYQDNFDFLVWFRKFFGANYRKKDYDPVAVRNGMPMKYGNVEVRRIYEKRASDALKSKLTLCRTKISLSERDMADYEDRQVAMNQDSSQGNLRRSTTQTLLKYETKSGQLAPNSSLSDVGGADYFSRILGGNQHHFVQPTQPSFNFKRSATRTIIKYNKELEEPPKEAETPTPPNGKKKAILPPKGAKLIKHHSTPKTHVRTKLLKPTRSYSATDISGNYEPVIYTVTPRDKSEVCALKSQLEELQRTVDQKNRDSCEIELELIRTQNDINGMRVEVRRVRQERDSYFSKMQQVAMCCRKAQMKGELTIPISEVLRIFLSEQNYIGRNNLK